MPNIYWLIIFRCENLLTSFGFVCTVWIHMDLSEWMCCSITSSWMVKILPIRNVQSKGTIFGGYKQGYISNYVAIFLCEIIKQGITTKEFSIVVEHYSWWQA